MARLSEKHIRFAQLGKNMATSMPKSRSPKSILALGESYRKRYKLKVVYKRGTGKWGRTSTTMFRKLWLSKNFEDQHIADRAHEFMHELVHARQWRSVGRVRFAIRYLNAQWRWAYEVEARREAIRVMAHIGAKKRIILDYIERQARGGLKKGYSLGRLDQKQVETETRRILLDQLDAA